MKLLLSCCDFGGLKILAMLTICRGVNFLASGDSTDQVTDKVISLYTYILIS
jgi:hypothetical protein